MTDPLTHVTDYQYNERDWLTKVTQPDPDGTGPLDRPESVYAYDDAGNLTSQGEPDFFGAPIQFVYDAAGRRIASSRNGYTTGYEFDALDRLTKVTDPLNHWTTYQYDVRDQVTQVKRSDASGVIPPGGIAVEAIELYSYDPAGQLTEWTNGRGYVTKYVYDAAGQLSTVYAPDPDGSDPATTGPMFRPWTSYLYDSSGRLTEMSDALQHTTTYAYNNRDWVTSITQPDPDGSGSLTSPVQSFGYDVAGRNTTAPIHWAR